jgi:hypothetical protein
MRIYKIALAVVGVGMLLALSAHAQTATVVLPPTDLENFELQTNTVIVKGSSLVGSVALDSNSSFVIHAREANDIGHSQKAYGITVELSGSLPSGAPAKMQMVVDYDELDSLTTAFDYMGKVTWGVTQLNSFEADYATRSGFHVVAHSDRRQSVINTFIQFGNLPRLPISSDQLAQMRSLVAQAKSTLDSLK